MSVVFIDRVFRHSKQKGTALSVMLAIADYADDEGIAYPSMGTLAKKTRISERHLHRVVKQPIESGKLQLDISRGPHGTNLFTIKLLAADGPLYLS